MRAGLADTLNDDAMPFCMVAHVDDRYVGSALGIAADLDDRPQYSPWVAAVWVEPDYRLHKVGRALVHRTARAFIELGFQRVYLTSVPGRRDFYTRQGWASIEEDVGARSQIVYAIDAAQYPA